MSRIPQVNPAVPAITPPAEVGAALAYPKQCRQRRWELRWPRMPPRKPNSAPFT